MRELRWTADSEAHIARHAVGPAEVEDVVYSRPRLVVTGNSGTRLVFGATAAGRYLVVVPADAADGRWFVVTARDMTDGERRTFVRRAR